nr:hypothetical protein Iba_chr10fCG4770 [Ipomoea batatas]
MPGCKPSLTWWTKMQMVESLKKRSKRLSLSVLLPISSPKSKIMLRNTQLSLWKNWIQITWDTLSCTIWRHYYCKRRTTQQTLPQTVVF